MKALVVESSSTMRSVLRRLLLVRGFEVSEADNGRNALDVLHDMGKADLVLVDAGLQEMESLEFITRLRHEAARDTEIVILAEREPGTRELHRALIAGADDYLVKPFTSKQIDEKLAQAGFSAHWHCDSDRQDQSCRY
jgi:two-component system chemotaxis response regulator CheY